MKIAIETEGMPFRGDDTKIGIGIVKDVSPELVSRARLSDYWAFALVENGMSEADLDRYAVELNRYYEQQGLAITLAKTDTYWVMFGDLEGLVERIRSDLQNRTPAGERIYAPAGFSFMTELMPEMQKLKKETERYL